MIRLLTAFAVFSLLLTACAKQEVLDPIDGTVPDGVDLSGSWSIRAGSGDDQRRLQEAIRKTDGVRDGATRSTQASRAGQTGRQSNSGDLKNRPRGAKGGLVFVFLEIGDALKLTQTEYALYVSFDRSVVEEFRFGERRIVSVGAIQAQRVTGWQEQSLVVETLDKNNMKLTERYQLADGGKTLQRLITFRSKKMEEESILQEFDRAD